jgi:CheY-like chemotaxis protein
LPICAKDLAPPPPVPPPTPTSRGGSETILLVEDEAQVLYTACSLLEGLGYHVIPVQDPTAVQRAVLNAARVDLLLTDVVMPGLSGPELWEQLKPQYPDLKVLFMSGFAATREELLRPGTDYPLLEKPFTRHALACKVREVLDRPAARQVVLP